MSDTSLRSLRRDWERQTIVWAIKVHSGVAAAARALKVNRTYLHKKMNSLGITVDRPPAVHLVRSYRNEPRLPGA